MNKVVRKFFRLAHVPSVLVMCTLFYLSSRTWTFQEHFLQPPLDKVMHLSVFTALGISFCVWIRGARWIKHPMVSALIIIACVGVFGASDEFHQSFVPGRDASIDDWMADFSGGIVSALLFLATKAYRITDKLHR